MRNDLPSQVAIIGLGYVGLPLATLMSHHLPTIGFDIDTNRIQELRQGIDRNGEIKPEALTSPLLTFTDEPQRLSSADFLIVAVPTPVDKGKRPDLSYIIGASQIIGQILKNREQKQTSKKTRPIIVYESTVYPGCTEEVCIPILEKESGLKVGKNFSIGYSPERVNFGDSEYSLENVVKIVSAQDQETLEVIANTYGLIVKAGICKVPDIRTAEAAKVVENIQRDINIALMNELAILFHSLDLDTKEVLKAARTKWNFLPFQPGLVGGHCIPVDPYYLTYKAEEVGYYPEIILSGRRINDFMGKYVAQETVKLLIQANKVVQNTKVLVLGVTFKENVKDARNTRVVDLVQELETYGVETHVYDPMLDNQQLLNLDLNPTHDPFSPDVPSIKYDAVILAVAHKDFLNKQIKSYIDLLDQEKGPGVLVDVKSVLQESEISKKGHSKIIYWNL